MITPPITIEQNLYGYPLGADEPPKVDLVGMGGMVCMSRPHIEALISYNYEIKRYVSQCVARLDAFTQQVLDNNTHSGVAGDGDPLHALTK